jgi:hypothetical protein
VHYDKKRWGDPEEFRPERHLDDRGELVADEWLLPFGLGEYTVRYSNTKRQQIAPLASCRQY